MIKEIAIFPAIVHFESY